MSKKHWLRGAIVASLFCSAWCVAAAETASDPLYTHVITGDMATDQAWQDAGVLGKAGVYKFKGTDGQAIKPVFTEPVHNDVYAVIAPKTAANDIQLTIKKETMNITADGTGLTKPKLYLVYNDQDVLVDFDGNRSDYVLHVTGPEGATGAIIHAATETGKAKVFRDRGQVGFTATSDNAGIVGLEAGKNGFIVVSSADDVLIKTKGNYALKATDGGVIYLKGVVEADGHAAIYAGNGGEVHHGYMYLTNVDKVMEGSDSHLTGDAFADEGGLVDLHFKNANWVGNALGTGNKRVQLVGNTLWQGGGELNYLRVDFGAQWQLTNQTAVANRVDELTGSANKELTGTINMTAGKSLAIDHLSGNLAFAYVYDSEAKNFKGGNVVIRNVKDDHGKAFVIMRATQDGIDLSTDDKVLQALNSLAGKLTYAGYVKGERNLEGRAEITEGLTSSYAMVKMGDLEFIPQTGQAKVATPSNYLSDIITGNLEKDQKYVSAGITSDAKAYDFQEDAIIRALYNLKQDDPLAMAFSGCILPDEGNEVVVDMHGHDLTLTHLVEIGEMQQHVSAGIYVPKAGSVIINNPGKINIDTIADYYYMSGISAGYRTGYSAGNLPSQVIINNDNSPENIVKIRGKLTSGSGYDINYTGIKTFAGGEVIIKGLADIYSDGAWALGGVGKNSLISIGGGSIVARNYSAIDAYSDANVLVNIVKDGDHWQAGTKPVRIIGAAQPFGNKYVGTWSKGYISIGLNTPESYWQGVAMTKYSTRIKDWIGEVRLQLANGATWNNAPNDWTEQSPIELAKSKTELESRIIEFIGSDSMAKSGLIIQNTMTPITLNSYQGATTIAYKHGDQMKYNYKGEVTGIDKEDVVIGGDITINNAIKGANGENASITLRIDNEGIDTGDEEQVRTWLNKLANKLYYKGYVDGERNLDARAEIAEGLTAYSAAWVKRGDMDFTEAKGQGYIKDDTAITTNENPKEGPRPKVVHVGKTLAGKQMLKYYAVDDQLYIFEHNPNSPEEVYGGNVTIGKAEEGSHIRLRTDNDGIDIHNKEAVCDALNGLAGKLFYQGYVDGERNLNGQAEIAEGLTAQSALMKFGKIQYRDSNGQGYFETVDDIHTTNPEIIYGPKETAMMRGAKSAMAGAMLTWREENNDLNKRLGSLRIAGEEAGAWGRLYGGKTKFDKDNASYKTEFKAVQVGYDNQVNDAWRAGIAFSYIEGDNTYALGGSGDTKLASLALYGTHAGEDGTYLDVIAKGSRVKTDYTVFNDTGHRLDGDFKTNGMTFSIEYGKKLEKRDGIYLVPQVELIYGHLASKDYDAKSSYAGNKPMHVEQGSFNSLVGRLGVSVGKVTDTTDMYAKVSVLHEFDGEVTTTFSAEGEPVSSIDQDFGDTWMVLGIGGTHKLSDRAYLYGNLERSFGGDVQTEWRADLGLRWRF